VSGDASTTSNRDASVSEIREKIVGTFTCVNGFMAAHTPDNGERLKDLIHDGDTAAIKKMVLQGSGLRQEGIHCAR
jgi:hypothetical protein